MSMRKQNAARGIQARQFIATSAQCACAALFALVLLSAGAANADLILPLAAFQADALSGASTKVVCGAPGPNCGGPLGTNQTTTPQFAELVDGPVHLLASTNPGPQIESLTTTASGTFGDPGTVFTGGIARALTTFYVAVEQTNPSVPAMAVPVTIEVGLSAGAEVGSTGGPHPEDPQILTSANLLVFEGSLIPAPHTVGGVQTYSANDVCSVAGCTTSVCELGICTPSAPSTTVTLHRGFVPGDTLLLLFMIAQGNAGGFLAGDFNALVDPQIFIDPTFPFANDFAIVLSPNIITAASAVPEPASALLLGPAALGLGLLALRKRRSSGRG
jgi:hypothetical protein